MAETIRNSSVRIKPQPRVVKEQIRVYLYELDVFRSSGVINWMANKILKLLAITLQNSCKINADLKVSNKKQKSLKLFHFLYNFTIHFFLSGCSSPFLPPRLSITSLLCVLNLNGS